ncbi:MAG TPA: ABC transporter ATP-binding protein [Nocardioidaceae bacterium]|nr:ABC transporter ATP-binding protein [Nocardioidaceae bacterium]
MSHPTDDRLAGHSSYVLEVDSVVRRFGGVTAVDGITVSLASDERLAVIGPNGAGKTTLFRLIAGEVAPTSGTITLFGRDVTRWPTRRRARLGVSRTFQVSNLFPNLSVLDNVRLAAQVKDMARWQFWPGRRGRGADGERIAEVLESLMLTARSADPVSSLSHGERRQLEIAMSLVVTPRLLLLDEPAAGLSLVERARLREILEGLPRSIPFLLIEHDLTLALELADRVLCMENGRPIALGTPEQVRADRHVQEVYLGRSATA